MLSAEARATHLLRATSTNPLTCTVTQGIGEREREREREGGREGGREGRREGGRERERESPPMYLHHSISRCIQEPLYIYVYTHTHKHTHINLCICLSINKDRGIDRREIARGENGGERHHIPHTRGRSVWHALLLYLYVWHDVLVL